MVDLDHFYYYGIKSHLMLYIPHLMQSNQVKCHVAIMFAINQLFTRKMNYTFIVACTKYLPKCVEVRDERPE